jgi:hypothetical protein
VKSIFSGIRNALIKVGEKIAMVTTPIFMAVFYFTVIAIAGIVAGVVRADLLHRRTAGNPTFWFRKPKEPMDETRYRAQF